MHVFVNAASANMGGAVTYLLNLVPWLSQVAPDDRFTVCAPPATLTALEQQGHYPNVALMPFPHARTGGVARLWFDQVEVPRILRQCEADVLFSSTGFGSVWSPRPQVLLVRNAAYFSPAFQEKYRQLGRSLRKNTVRRWHSLVSVHCANAILFPTRATADLVQSYVPMDASRVVVLHYGFDQKRFFAEAVDETLPAVRTMQEWRADGEQVLLSVSTYAVHKNFETLIEALALLRRDGRRVKLITTTDRERTTDRVEYDQLRARAAELGVQDDWIESGYVPHDRLQQLYREADVYVFPSFIESFGHSMVEAMACGVPVVAADEPVNREVCRDAGLYFSTFDADDAAARLAHVLSDVDERRRLTIYGQDRATHFSWQRYAGHLVDMFRQAARRQPQSVAA